MDRSKNTLISDANVPLDRDLFFRSVLRQLTGILQDTVGLEDASGFISVVGQHIGDELNTAYKSALSIASLDKEQVAAVLVDLKDKIGGDFKVISLTDEKIVLQSTSCPFGEKVIDRPSLCMVTSNVFGVITADNLGYAKVQLQETIANGDPGCKVTIFLKENQDNNGLSGVEYFKG